MSALDNLIIDCMISPDVWRDARAELAALRSRIAELEAQATTLTPRRCSRECYLRGWQAAIEAAAMMSAGIWHLKSVDGEDYEHVVTNHIADCIRDMQPPADCGCNPLKPE